MPGPNSAPNGDTTIIRGHVNEEFLCDVHASKQMEICWVKTNWYHSTCNVMSKRDWLAKRNRLTTGKS